jgi:hypothetical protein
MTSRRSLHLHRTATTIAALTVLAILMSFADGKAEGQPQERPVSHTRIEVDKYQNFIGNWDQTTNPVLYALLQTPAQYAALFHPAPVMGDARPFAPPPREFETNQIVVIARGMPAPEDMKKVFAVERIAARGAELIVFYRFNEPNAGASYKVKNHLCLRIPKDAYRKVRFYENGKLSGELNTAAGQWSVPVVP